jgi:hypothetical protein
VRGARLNGSFQVRETDPARHAGGSSKSPPVQPVNLSRSVAFPRNFFSFSPLFSVLSCCSGERTRPGVSAGRCGSPLLFMSVRHGTGGSASSCDGGSTQRT